MKRAPLPKSRVLVLIADEICGRCLARELTDRGEGPEGTSLVLIAPALVHSRTEAWADDIDADIAEAERKVDVSVALLRRQGYETIGKVGDSNPSQAIEDGLAEFAPDSVIVATHPADRMSLLELRQIGGSIGTALLAVVLQHEVTAHISSAGGAGGLLAPVSASERPQISGPLATAFGHTFMWAAGMSLLALLAAVGMLRAERAQRRPTAPVAASPPDPQLGVPQAGARA
jgi:hypothetical protein